MKKLRKNRRGKGSFFLRLAVIAVACTVGVSAQRKTSHREPTPGSMIRESEVDYQLWESFVLMRKANDGEAPAQHELGLRYLTGKGFEPDTEKAALWVQRAASQDYVLGHYNLGIFYHNGWGVEWNPFQAYRRFVRAANQKLPEAEFVLGLILTEDLVVSQDWQKAYNYVRLAADEGFEPALKALAEFERRGIRGVADTGKARSPLDSGQVRPVFLDFNVDTASHADEKTLIRDLLREASPELRKALGVPESAMVSAEHRTNMTFIENAAELGSPEALTLLGRMYEGGLGVQPNRIRASAYYVRAIRLESQRAPELLWNLIQEEGYREELEKKALAFDPEARFVWAGLVASKFDQILSGEQALKLLQSAANENNRQAIIELGLCFQSGRWVQQDRTKSLQLWQIAASMGSPEARIRLIAAAVLAADMRAFDEQTLAFLQSASEEGSILAQVVLGFCSERGIRVPVDKGEAARTYRNAAQRGSQSAYQALRRMHDEIRPAEEEFEIEGR